MIKIDPPDLSLKEFLDACFDSDTQKKTKETKSRMRPYVEAFSEFYEEAAPINEFHKLIDYHEFLNNLILHEKELNYVKQLYSYRLRKHKNGRALYDHLIFDVSDSCPYCYFGTVRQVDHFIPQAAYCIWNIHPKNLIPICADCNRDKNDYMGKSLEKNLLHPYFDDFSKGQWLFAEIKIKSGRVKYKVNYRCKPVSIFTKSEEKRLKNNFDILKLADRFEGISRSQRMAIKIELDDVLGEKNDVVRRSYLKRLIDSKINTFGFNYWSVALYQAFFNYNGNLDDLF